PALHPVESPAAGPVAGGATTSGWGDAGRAAAEQEVSPARTPRLAPLRVDARAAGPPRRHPRARPPPCRLARRREGTGPPAARPRPVPAPRPRHAGGAPPRPAPAAHPTGGGGGPPPAGPLPARADRAAKPHEPSGTAPYPVVGAAASSLEPPSVFSAPAVAS